MNEKERWGNEKTSTPVVLDIRSRTREHQDRIVVTALLETDPNVPRWYSRSLLEHGDEAGRWELLINCHDRSGPLVSTVVLTTTLGCNKGTSHLYVQSQRGEPKQIRARDWRSRSFSGCLSNQLLTARLIGIFVAIITIITTDVTILEAPTGPPTGPAKQDLVDEKSMQSALQSHVFFFPRIHIRFETRMSLAVEKYLIMWINFGYSTAPVR